MTPLQPDARIAIFQIWGLGDLIMTVPAITALKQRYPQSRISLIVRGAAQRALLKDSSLIEEILELPPRALSWRTLAFFARLRSRRFDAALIGTRITPFLALLTRVLAGVRVIVGDARRGRFLYTRTIDIDPQEHRVDRMLRIAALLTGAAPTPAVFDLPLPISALAEARRILAAHGLAEKNYLAIHPGSSLKAGPDKRIPAQLSQDIALQFRRRNPQQRVAVLLGPEEADLLPVFKDIDPGIVVISGQPLGVTQAILCMAACFAGSDSSLGHVAAAYGVATVTLAGPTLPTETRPYGRAAAVVTRGQPLPCQPCWGTPLYGHCPYGAQCMKDIAAPQVLAQIHPRPLHA